MVPRLLLKTHAQVRHPGIFSILIDHCTSPVSASHADRVSNCLAEVLGRSSGSFKAASSFAVLMAQGLGFLTRNMTWGANGLVINTVLHKCGKTKEEDIAVFLTPPYSLYERIAYLRYYLEADGALLWAIMKRVHETRELSTRVLGVGMRDLFLHLNEEYLNLLELEPRNRGRVRQEIARLGKQAYNTGTIPHKLWPHAQPLVDLGLLSLHEVQGESFLRSTFTPNGPTASLLVEDLGSLEVLERTFSDDVFFGIIARQFFGSWSHYDELAHEHMVSAALQEGYSLMKNESTGLAPVEALCDWVCIELLAACQVVCERDQVRQYLRRIYREHSGALRFEVDFHGRPAFIELK